MKRKKVMWWFIALYTIYLLTMAAYFFVWSKSVIPADMKGTAADPSLFMNKHQLAESGVLNAWRHFLSFATIPLEWGVYLFVLIGGLSLWLKKCSVRISSLFIVQMFLCYVSLALISALVFLPVEFASYQLSVHYGISVQPIQDWLKDQGISTAISTLIGFIMMTAVVFLIRRYPKRWWFPAWLLSIPFVFFMMYLQPVVIDPLYNHFQSLQDGELKAEILQMAEKAGIPAHNVYEVDMSSETNAMNAYVNGMGSHLRIVLWDTTVHRLSHKEVLFVMAHEMGHYVMHHIIWGTAAALLGLLLTLWIAAKIHLWASVRWGAKLNMSHPGDLTALPMLLLILSLLSFAGEPVQNMVSREFEQQADQYAIEMTQDKKAAISSFQKLSASSLSEMNPPALVKWIQYDHPTMLERINYLEHVKTNK
ncbi:M48 family metallopeptidase [Sporolactobacillus nakayamae]|uniref:Zn-dependent protease with chaperone function n=1 Tax=Sporolactobacillus nakayamae TaxID=269670 RepID=A0A1I2TV15_9BACL|nr:M48 family metallopeptidase [Sporolactobacillus nakayamae]SFG68720.1 Zn-dependent protease with chaperone function [Sporolactobacillus nakayamae]